MAREAFVKNLNISPLLTATTVETALTVGHAIKLAREGQPIQNISIYKSGQRTGQTRLELESSAPVVGVELDYKVYPKIIAFEDKIGEYSLLVKRLKASSDGELIGSLDIQAIAERQLPAYIVQQGLDKAYDEGKLRKPVVKDGGKGRTIFEDEGDVTRKDRVALIELVRFTMEYNRSASEANVVPRLFLIKNLETGTKDFFIHCDSKDFRLFGESSWFLLNAGIQAEIHANKKYPQTRYPVLRSHVDLTFERVVDDKEIASHKILEFDLSRSIKSPVPAIA